MRGDLSAALGAYDWLAIAMQAIAPGWRTGTLHRDGGSRPPVRVELVDQREQIAYVLRSWARMIGEEHTPALAGPADPSLPTVVRWLRARLPWCSDQPWCDQFAGELAELRADAAALVPWQGAHERMPAPCGSCGRLTLVRYSQDDAITCRNRDCGTVLSYLQYGELVFTWRARIQMQARRQIASGSDPEHVEHRLAVALAGDVEDPAAIWLTTEQAAEAAHVPPATVRSWAERGKITAASTPAGPRYREIDVLDAEAATRRGRREIRLLVDALYSLATPKIITA